MAEPHDEREVGRMYRELPREEPPERLDEAIRAQARRAGATRPAPLVPPTGRRSWYYPVAAAAVLVLAVAVTWHVDRDEPDLAANGTVAEVKKNDAQTKEERAPAVTAQQKEKAPPASDAAPRRRDYAQKPADQAARTPQEPAVPPASSVAPAAPPAPAAAPPAAGESAVNVEKRSMARAQVAETPEQWLERITKLRREGKHEEADKALAEFRKRYPDFQIPPAILEQVEKK